MSFVFLDTVIICKFLSCVPCKILNLTTFLYLFKQKLIFFNFFERVLFGIVLSFERRKHCNSRFATNGKIRGHASYNIEVTKDPSNMTAGVKGSVKASVKGSKSVSERDMRSEYCSEDAGDESESRLFGFRQTLVSHGMGARLTNDLEASFSSILSQN